MSYKVLVNLQCDGCRACLCTPEPTVSKAREWAGQNANWRIGRRTKVKKGERRDLDFCYRCACMVAELERNGYYGGKLGADERRAVWDRVYGERQNPTIESAHG